jgi:hypothetical protein
MDEITSRSLADGSTCTARSIAQTPCDRVEDGLVHGVREAQALRSTFVACSAEQVHKLPYEHHGDERGDEMKRGLCEAREMATWNCLLTSVLGCRRSMAMHNACKLARMAPRSSASQYSATAAAVLASPHSDGLHEASVNAVGQRAGEVLLQVQFSPGLRLPGPG